MTKEEYESYLENIAEELQSEEAKALFTAVEQYKQEKEKNGCYVLDPQNFRRYLKLERLARQLDEDKDAAVMVEYRLGLPMTSGSVTLRSCLLQFDDENGWYMGLREMLALADFVDISTEPEELAVVDIGVCNVLRYCPFPTGQQPQTEEN